MRDNPFMKNVRILLAIFAAMAGLCLWPQEKLVLTTPVTPVSTANLVVVHLELDWPGEHIMVRLRVVDSTNGVLPLDPLTFYYNGSNAIALMRNLNTNCFTAPNPSFQKKILQKLQADNFIGAGSVTGTPQ